MEFVSSGSTLLNLILTGNPDHGYPFGRIVNVSGETATGKTLLAVEAIIRCLKLKGDRDNKPVFCIYDETEAAFDLDYASRIGLPLDDPRFTLVRSKTVEDVYDLLEKWLLSKKENPFAEAYEELGYTNSKDVYSVYVLDSLDALTTYTELNEGMIDETYGTAKARKMSKLFRMINADLNQHNVLLFIISQFRENVGQRFGSKYAQSGGMAIKYYSSQRITLNEIGKIKDGDNVIGIAVEAITTKNKVFHPYRKAKLMILFEYGIDEVRTNLQYLEDMKIVHSDRGWYTWKDKKYRLKDLVNYFYDNQEEMVELREMVIKTWQDQQKEFQKEKVLLV